jgi:hypothetical protein
MLDLTVPSTSRKTSSAPESERSSKRSPRGERLGKTANVAGAQAAKRQGRGAVLLRLTGAENAFLAEVVPSPRERARFLHRLLSREMEHHRRLARAAMFAAAAAEVDEEEKAERRSLLSAFSNRD